MTAYQMIEDIISKEGGYVDHPMDRGGPTNYGITIKTLEAYRKRKQTADDVKNLSKTEAVVIFKSMYFDANRLEIIYGVSEPVAAFMFDWCVNSNAQRAIQELQKILKVVPDGMVGAKTADGLRAGLLNSGIEAFIDRLIDARVEYVLRYIQSDPRQAVFAIGWYRRIVSFRQPRSVKTG